MYEYVESGFSVGELVFGPGIPAGTTITSINWQQTGYQGSVTEGTITLSNPVSTTGDAEFDIEDASNQNCNTVAGSTTIAGTAARTCLRDRRFPGPGIPAGTVVSYPSSYSVTISNPATATSSGPAVLNLGGVIGTSSGAFTGGTDNRIVYQNTQDDPISIRSGTVYDNTTGTTYGAGAPTGVQYYEVDTVLSCNTTANNNTITVLSGRNALAANDAVTGPGIAAGTTISAISGNTVTLSQTALATGTAVLLTFQQVAPVSTGLTVSAMSVQETSAPVAQLSLSFSDSASVTAATINWGDGTSAQGTVNNTTKTISIDHIYAANGTYTVTATLIDANGATATDSTSFTGGLALVNGNLVNYIGSTATTLDTGVVEFLVRNTDSTVFSLHGNGNLFVISSSGQQQIGTGTTFTQIAQDGYGGIYALDNQGNLYCQPPYDAPTLELFATNIKSVLNDNRGILYVVDDSTGENVLWALEWGNWGGWDTTAPYAGFFNVQSIRLDPTNGSYIDVENGSLWYRFNPVDGETLLGGNHFVLSTPPVNATAGQPVTLTVTVLDYFGNPVTNYAGPDQLTCSDPAAQLSSITWNNGVGTLTVTFKTAGPQTVNIGDNLSTLPATSPWQVNVQSGQVSYFTVTAAASPVTVFSPTTIIVTAEDQYGNVATGYSGTIDFTSSDSEALLTLQASYALATAQGPGFENGQLTLTNVALGTVGAQWITVQDSSAIGTNNLLGTINVIVAPGLFDLSKSTISVGSSNLYPGESTPITLTMRDAYGNQETSGGLAVTFGVIGAGTLSPVPPTDNNDGTYTTTFTAGSAPGTTIVVAVVDQEFITSPPPEIVVAPDTTPPTVSVSVGPNTRSGPVESIAVAFSKPVRGLTLASLQLSLNGAYVPLPNSLNVTGVGAPLVDAEGNSYYQDWTVGNLSGLTYAGGNYSLAHFAFRHNGR